MKKVLLALVLASLLATLVLPVAVLAIEEIPTGCTMKYDVGITGCPSSKYIDESSNPDNWGICCMLNTIVSATNWFFYILIIISVIMIIYGGFSILFATGDPEKMKKGRGVIVYAIIGMAIALFAKVIPSIVRFIMGL